MQNYSFQDRKGELGLQGSPSSNGLPPSGFYELSSETPSFSRTPRHNASPTSSISANPIDPTETSLSKQSDSSLSGESVVDIFTRQDSIRHLRQMDESSQMDSVYPRYVPVDNKRRFGQRFEHPILYQMMMDPELRQECGLNYARQISAPQLSVERDFDEHLFGHALPSSSTRDPLSRTLHFSSPATYSPSYLGMTFENQSEDNRRSLNNRGNERRTEKPDLKPASHLALPGSPKKPSNDMNGLLHRYTKSPTRREQS